MIIRPISQPDIPACLAIYNYYISETTCTLELEPLDCDQFTARVREIRESCPYLVCELNGEVVGFAYLHPFSPRGGYAHTGELSIYLSRKVCGCGIGRKLAQEVLHQAKALGYRDVMAVITGENEVSLAFHRHLGFTDEAQFDGIAEKFDRRFSVHYMQYHIC